jgi:uncharacterized alpha/beta hydrolase family protein
MFLNKNLLIKIKYAGEDFQHGILAESTCVYYNLVNFLYS